VTEYWENDKEGGVVVNGEKLSGDVVIGADGVRSKARKLVLVSVCFPTEKILNLIEGPGRGTTTNPRAADTLYIALGLIRRSAAWTRILSRATCVTMAMNSMDGSVRPLVQRVRFHDILYNSCSSRQRRTFSGINFAGWTENVMGYYSQRCCRH